MSEKHSVFQEYNTMLFSFAYHMLAEVAAAGRVVRSVHRRWTDLTVEPGRQTRTWLLRATVFECIDHLKQSAVAGPFPPPQFSPAIGPPNTYRSLALDIMIPLGKLVPVERALFILREVFTCDFSELAQIFQLGEERCRQIDRKARLRLGESIRHFQVGPGIFDELLSNFMRACREQDEERIMNYLEEDVMLWAEAPPFPHPLSGRIAVCSFLLQIASRMLDNASQFRWEYVMANTLPSILAYINDEAACLASFESTCNGIRNIYIQANRAKLAKLCIRCH